MSTGSTTIDRDAAIAMTVGEVMLGSPKTVSADALVADVRRMFERASVRSVLLVDGDRFAGVIERDGLPGDASDDAPARAYAATDVVTATPSTPMRDAVTLIDAREEPRLIVLDEDGVTLRGLLCANTTGTGFCIRP